MSEKIEGLLKAQIALLTHIAKRLDALVSDRAPIAPNYRRQLSEYARFDWASIEAEVIAQDGHGASEVEWRGHRFTRRSGSGKFGQAVWFSRPTGRDDQSENTYARLITFKASVAEPLPGDVAQATPKAAPPQAHVSAQAKASIARAMVTAGAGQRQPTVTTPTQAQAVENSATAYWTLASQLIQSGKLTHDQAGEVAKDPASTWAEKAARLMM